MGHGPQSHYMELYLDIHYKYVSNINFAYKLKK